jgi:hypothetical protein
MLYVICLHISMLAGPSGKLNNFSHLAIVWGRATSGIYTVVAENYAHMKRSLVIRSMLFCPSYDVVFTG